MDHVTDPDAMDEAAFRLLFTTTYGALSAYARRRSSDPAEADDIVAEVYAVAWRRRADIDQQAQPLPWLYGIAANVIRNSRRAGNRRLQLVERLQAQPQTPGADESSPADDAPGTEIREALQRLSFDDSEVLRLVAWEGLSHEEAAKALGCSTNAVGIRIHRARRRLEAQLAEMTEPTGPDAIQSEPAITDKRRRGGANR